MAVARASRPQSPLHGRAREQRFGLVWGHGPHVVRYSVAYDCEEMKFALAELAREAGVELLLHAWGCDHRVHHATNEIPACFATGQAAGAAAALALHTGVEPAVLDVSKLRAHLLEAGAILG